MLARTTGEFFRTFTLVCFARTGMKYLDQSVTRARYVIGAQLKVRRHKDMHKAESHFVM